MTPEAQRIIKHINIRTMCRGCIGPGEHKALTALRMAVEELDHCTTLLNDHGSPRATLAAIESALKPNLPTPGTTTAPPVQPG